jgi:hypothetical protein
MLLISFCRPKVFAKAKQKSFHFYSAKAPKKIQTHLLLPTLFLDFSVSRIA